jgi:hypothetical protein
MQLDRKNLAHVIKACLSQLGGDKRKYMYMM